MKTLRIVLIAVIISALFVSSSALAQSGKIGYVTLLRQVAPGLPLYTQARQAFDQLAPQLLAAQQRGDILDFQPDFSAGIVAVNYAPGANLTASLNGLTLHDNAQVAIAAILHSQPAQSPSPSAAGPQFALTLGSSCVDMSGLGANSHVVGNLTDTSGRLVAALEGDASAAGGLSACFNTLGSYNTVLPGYRAAFNLYIAGNLTSYSALAPVINVTAFTKSTSVLNIQAPVGVAFSATWTHPNLDAGNTAQIVTKTGTVPATWSIDFGTVPFRGGDDFSITLTTATNFAFTRLFTTPYFYCALGGNSCGVYGIPAQANTLIMTHAGAPTSFTGKFNYSGWFGGSLFDTSGLPIFLTAGDTINSTGIATYSLPNLTAAINFSTDVVNGHAPANKYFWVLVYEIASSSQYSAWAHSSASGVYSSDFSSQLNMDAASAYAVRVYYADAATGNETYVYITYAPPSCYTLTRTHTGNGADPAALPLKSTACSVNYTYLAGEHISLTASPASGWGIGKWTGTDNAATNTGITDTLTMPFNNTNVSVKYSTSATYLSTGAQDGWVLESSENSNAGGSMNSAATTIYLGDDAARKQYRGILSFNTSVLPDTAVITSLTLKFQKAAVVGGGDPVAIFQGFMVDIKKGIFGTAILETGDFQAAASKSYGPFTAPVSNWYSINLITAKAYINPLSTNSGLTQIRLRFKLDDNNNAVANYLSLYSGNAPAASRPQLVITYYVP